MMPCNWSARRRVFVVAALLFLAQSIAFGPPGRLSASGAPGQEPAPRGEPAKPPPLEVDTDAPLLLDSPATEKAGGAAAKLADNSACFVCHVNFKAEPLAASHATRGVGCTDCHGDSVAHRNDENNITPPDIMFPRTTLDTACTECHDRHNVPARKVVARFLERQDTLKAEAGGPVCTSCHGEHRLPQRTVRWDRETGKLLARPSLSPKPAVGTP